MKQSFRSALILLALSSLPSMAWANSIELDVCSTEQEAGDLCGNAGGLSQFGVCVASACSRTAADGSESEVACLRCSATDPRGGSADDAGGGCTASPASATTSTWLLVGLGACAFVARRRRR